MHEKENNFIIYQPIEETGTAENNFYEILTEKIKVFSTKDYSSENAKQRYKTIFLNGPWGSGKSQFIKNVETNPDKSLRKKFIYLDLWRIKDNRTTLTIAFSKLHPIIYWLSKVIAILAVGLSLTLTPIFGVNVVELFKDIAWIKIIAITIILFLGVWQFMKYKSDDFYYTLFNCKLLSLENKVIVIDDFDRISKEKQHEAYKFFDIIQGKLPVLFVGDYNKICENDNDNYLSKIIDRRVELPEVLQSHHVFDSIWRQFKDKFIGDMELPKNFLHSPSEDIKKFILNDNRSLREIHQFTNILNHEFINKGKFSTVQPYQQFLIIYLYLFYPNLYKQIFHIRPEEISSNIIDQEVIAMFEDKKRQIKLPFTLQGNTDRENEMIKLLSNVLVTDGDDIFPYPFLKRKTQYLINEEVSNLSVVKAKQILQNKSELIKIIKNPDLPIAIDFEKYLRFEYSLLPQYWTTDYNVDEDSSFYKEKIMLERIVFTQIKQTRLQNPIIELVVNNLQHAIYYEAKSLSDNLKSPNSKKSQLMLQKLEKRTSMRSPYKEASIEVFQYMLWNQFISKFDFDTKKYFFDTYYLKSKTPKNQIIKPISKNDWAFIEENGFIQKQLNIKTYYL
ncbi:P-loop NTPase fold protein [Lactococcus petauri]|uniref:P-loop NTPase fold protein n=1 Tax=Lactococcus petauri TaxID=1940789 RepID=UPI003852C064